MFETHRLITTLARTTSVCENHGQIIQCLVRLRGVFSLGCYFEAPVYECTFEDSTSRSYWVRAGVPTEIRSARKDRTP